MLFSQVFLLRPNIIVINSSISDWSSINFFFVIYSFWLLLTSEGLFTVAFALFSYFLNWLEKKSVWLRVAQSGLLCSSPRGRRMSHLVLWWPWHQNIECVWCILVGCRTGSMSPFWTVSVAHLLAAQCRPGPKRTEWHRWPGLMLCWPWSRCGQIA